jgi:predicted RNase H-like nuclease (RuvC/YqgF family)
MENSRQSKLKEYTELSETISRIEKDLAQEKTRQEELQREIEGYYELLKSEFSKRWPPLTMKQA